MSIIQVNENWKMRTARIDTESGGAVRVFDVEFDAGDAPNVRILLARDANEIPQIYDPHPYDNWLFVVSKSAKAKGGPLFYEITVNYSSVKDPLSQDPEVEYYFATSNEPVDRDIDDNALTNSSNESFDPPITKDMNDLVIRIKKNEPQFDPAVASEFKGAVNQDVFRGYDPGQVLCTVFDGRKARASDLNYWEVTYEFQVRADGWKRQILDEGFREKTGTDSEGKATYKLFIDDDGKTLTQPVLLSGDGKQLADGGDIHKLEFELNESKTFSTLNLA